MNDQLRTAINAVNEASRICSRIQEQLVAEDALTKKDRSPVTVADFASQAVICKTLKEYDVGAVIVGEEDAAGLRQADNAPILQKIQQFLPEWQKDEIIHYIDQGNGTPAKTYWTLDPIDGTKGFLRGDQYAIALALIHKGEVVLGVLGCPNLAFSENNASGTLMYAVNSEGAHAQQLSGSEKRRAAVSENTMEDTIRFLESVESGHANHSLQGKIMQALHHKARAVRYDSQVKYAVLAQGLADVYLRMPNPDKPDYREKIWDHAAGYIVVKEAGGRVSDMFGHALDFNAGKKLVHNRGVVATNGRIHDAMIRLIEEKNRKF